MSFDLMSYFRDAWSWAGGTESKAGTKLEGHAAAGADQFQGTSHVNDLLGGMIGGFGMPLEWKGAGFGAGIDGKVAGNDGGYASGHLGAGAGAASGTWAGVDGPSQKIMTGMGGVVGGTVPIGVGAGTNSAQASASTNLYDAVGGSMFHYNKDADHGYGVNANYVPVGVMDTNVGVDTRYGSARQHADDAYFGKLSGSASAGENDGTYHGDVSGSLKTGVDGFRSTVSSGAGTVDAAGSVYTETSAGFGGGYNPKTGAVEAHGSYGNQLGAKGVSAGYSSPSGRVSASVGASEVSTGMSAGGEVAWDPTKNALHATGAGHGGGVVVQDARARGSITGVGTFDATLGEFSNDLRIDKAYADIDADHAKVGASVDGGGLRFAKGSLAGQLGSGANALKAQAGFGSLGNNNSVDNAYADINWDQHSLKGGFDKLSVGNWSGSKLHADVEGPFGVNAHAKVNEFKTGLAAEGFDATYDKNGFAANLAKAEYNSLNVSGVDYKAGIGDQVAMSGHLGELGLNHSHLKNAHVDSSWKNGVHASAEEASYDSVALKDLQLNQQYGGVYESHLGLGDGSFNHFEGKNLSAGIDKTGARAHLEDGKYSYLAGENISVKQSMFNKALGLDVGAKSASLGGIEVGSADFTSNVRESHLDVQNANAHGWKSEDIHAKANAGALGVGMDARTLNLLDAHVGSAKADLSGYGTKGAASVTDANLDAVNAKGAHAGMSWNGKEVVGASGDFRTGGGVAAANAGWDLSHGKAGASVKDANVSSQLSNAHLNLFGSDIAVPDMGYKLNASAGANLDLSHGAASANVGLGGSSVNFGGHQLTVPEWVQAAAGVDASRGAANFQLGGSNGVGADLSIADGNFDINAFGYTLDVDGGIRDGANAIGRGASAVGGAISDGASAVWDALPSLSLPSLW